MIELSPYQEHFWLDWKINPESKAYSTYEFIYRLKGKLDLEKLKFVLNDLVNRDFELARARFVDTEFGPRQEILGELPVELHQAKIKPRKNKDKQIKEFIESIVSIAFDLSNPPLFKFGLFEVDFNEYIFVLNFHHIILDPTGATQAVELISKRYNEYDSVEKEEIQYPGLADYIAFEKANYPEVDREVDLNYWQEHLKGVPLCIDYPFKLINGATHNHARYIFFKLSEEKAKQLKSVCRSERITPFIFISAVFAALLRRYGVNEKMAFSYPLNTRTSGFKNFPGCFVNNLPLVVDCCDQETFSDLFQKIRNQRKSDKRHQRAALTDILMRVPKDERVNALNTAVFETMMSPPCFEMKGVQCDNYYYADLEAIADLGMSYQLTETIEFRLDYRSAYFPDAVIDELVENFKRLVNFVLEEPKSKVVDFSLLSDAAKQALLFDWNDTAVDFPEGKTITQLFEEQVEQNPDCTALIDREVILTYRELNDKANALAHNILDQFTVKPDDCIVVYSAKKSEMMIGFLAALKCGAAYVALDDVLTDVQISQIIDEVKPPVALYGSEHEKERFLKNKMNNDLLLSLQVESDPALKNPQNNAGPNNLFYVIFTSGSTGKPKGVMIEHRSYISLVKANSKNHATSVGDSLAEFYSLTFDAGVFQIWEAWLNGARLVCYYEDQVKDIYGLKESFLKYNITILNLPTGLFDELSALSNGDLFDGLKHLVVGGDLLKLQSVLQLADLKRPPKHLYNAYGPTEVTCTTTMFEVQREDLSNILIPIGKPMANTKVYVLDEAMQLVPIGVPGELHIAGVQLARGYLNDPELTAQKFIDNPFSPGERLYKTGDRVCWAPDGNLQFLERLDHQVKVRGYRIDISEIELRLSEHPDIAQVVVTNPDKNQLAAFYRTKSGKGLSDDLVEFLSRTLPAYKIPSLFVFVEKFPLNKNGKIDKKKLIPPKTTQVVKESAGSEVEYKLKALWQKVLKLDDIGIQESFTSLGGHSLSAVSLMGKVNKAFGLKLPVNWVFEYRTIKAQAKALENQDQMILSEKPIITFNESGELPPLFLVPPVGASVFIYKILAASLSKNQPCFGVQCHNLQHPKEKTLDMTELARIYVSQIRELKPKGPYRLAGWSLGGTLALIIARLIQEQGELVEQVVLFDSILLGSKVDEKALTFEQIESELFVQFEDEISKKEKSTYLRAFQESMAIARSFRPFKYEGDVTLLKSTKKNQSIEFKGQSWEEYLKKLTTIPTDVGHGQLLQENNVEALKTLFDGL